MHAYHNISYQHIVHQSLIHTPTFLHWIKTHDQPRRIDHNPDDCLMCSYKRLAELYWHGPLNPVNVDGMIVNAPIPHDNQDVTKIWQRAMAARPAEFGPNVPLGDAGEVYEWVVNELKWPEPAGGFAPREKRKKRWNEEHSALFETIFLGVVMCMVCRTVRQRGPWRQSMIELDARTPFTTLEEMLHRTFFSTRRNGHCHTYGVVQRHEVVREITAAPQVLRIRVLITNKDGAQPTKNMTNWIFLESLNLRMR
jgi:hypothetical protein